MDTLENAGRHPALFYRERTLYTTLSSCAMCSGAVLLYGSGGSCPRSFPSAKLMAKAWEIATHIAEEAAPLAVRGSKKAIMGALDLGPTKGIPYTWTVRPDIQDTEDTKEGFRSFVEKRKPVFKGR